MLITARSHVETLNTLDSRDLAGGLAKWEAVSTGTFKDQTRGHHQGDPRPAGQPGQEQHREGRRRRRDRPQGRLRHGDRRGRGERRRCRGPLGQADRQAQPVHRRPDQGGRQVARRVADLRRGGRPVSAVRRHGALLLAVLLLAGAGVAFWQAHRERDTDNVGNFAQVDDVGTEKVVAAVSTALVRSFRLRLQQPRRDRAGRRRGAARQGAQGLRRALRDAAQEGPRSAGWCSPRRSRSPRSRELEGDHARLLVFMDQASQRVSDKAASYYAAQALDRGAEDRRRLAGHRDAYPLTRRDSGKRRFVGCAHGEEEAVEPLPAAGRASYRGRAPARPAGDRAGAEGQAQAEAEAQAEAGWVRPLQALGRAGHRGGGGGRHRARGPGRRRR
ncbi:hypothetical protein G5V59_11850 [Nocardioides sp. W3-2-3]|uniref:hypothetical protein n=1 Tax=Nocardioides convexus TaxID=2712224 RepID=UPI00241826B2|nr:hypothetical protein [Nocardioides convexus]NHA00486.1 hypothetical protein [Nocardioides convexus]